MLSFQLYVFSLFLCKSSDTPNLLKIISILEVKEKELTVRAALYVCPKLLH